MQENIEQKSINNAISAYLMIGVSWLFIFNKDNQYINNDFVKKHTKSSILIHLLVIFTYIIFILNGLFKDIIIFGFGINVIITSIIFLFLMTIMIYGIYKASKGEIFNIGDFIKANKNISLDINTDKNKLSEKDKLTIVTSFIPFIGYIIGAKYKNHQIENILKYNIFISVIITIIYILGYTNVSTIFILIYIISTVFISVNLFIRDELTTINLPDYFSPSGKLTLQKNIIKYVKHYIKGDFKEFKVIVSESKSEKEIIEKKESEEINNLRDIKMPEALIYIPIINLFTLLVKENNYKLHIRNGLTITFISILMLTFIILGHLSPKVLILLLFPICFGLGYLKIKYYKMPYIYQIFILFEKVKGIFIKSKNDLKEKHNEVNEINLKVK